MSDVRLHPIVIRLRHRLRGVQERLGVLVEGPAGWGEWSPVPGFPCDPAQAWRAALEAATVAWPTPLRHQIPVNALIGDDASIGECAPTTRCVKIKVGDDGDINRVAAVRDRLGPNAIIRVDANGAWDVETACARLTSMAKYDIALAEQPVADIEGLAQVRRRVAMPVAADECIRSRDDIDRLRALDAADVVVLKVQACGGVYETLEWAARANVPTVVSSMLETSVGLAAGLACAAALPELALACGLGTATLLVDDVVDDALLPQNDMVALRRPAVVAERLAECSVPEPPEAFLALQERFG